MREREREREREMERKRERQRERERERGTESWNDFLKGGWNKWLFVNLIFIAF